MPCRPCLESQAPCQHQWLTASQETHRSGLGGMTLQAEPDARPASHCSTSGRSVIKHHPLPARHHPDARFPAPTPTRPFPKEQERWSVLQESRGWELSPAWVRGGGRGWGGEGSPVPLAVLFALLPASLAASLNMRSGGQLGSPVRVHWSAGVGCRRDPCPLQLWGSKTPPMTAPEGG